MTGREVTGREATGRELTGLRAGPLRGAAELARAAGVRHAPTPEQVAVIEAPLEPLLVVAGAGSGKTETMAARVVWLVENELVRPEQVLALTFTRKAAGELGERVAGRLRRVRGRAAGPALGDERPRVATYNAYAAGLVRDHALRVGADPDARLLTEAGRWQLAERIVEGWPGDIPADAAPGTVVGAVLDLAGAFAEHLLDPDDAARQLLALADSLADKAPSARGARRAEPRREVREVMASLRARAALTGLVEELSRRKRDLGVVDFADQVALACRIAGEVPQVGADERERYRVVLLDEYQDTSVAQAELLSRLFGAGHPVTAVGDPHQSIYGWRGASAGALQRFATRFRRADGSPAGVLTLATSWRNDEAVLAVANAVAGPLRTPPSDRATEHVALPVLAARPGAGPGRVRAIVAQTAPEEAAAVAAVLDEARRRRANESGSPGTAAVLCRARAQMPGVAEALRERGVPVEVVGLGGLLSTPEVADVHAALLCAHDPSRADAAMRLLTRSRLGVADLAVLHERAKVLARTGLRAGGAARTGAPERAGAPERTGAPEPASVLEAVERPPRPDEPMPSGRTISAAGAERVRALGAALRTLRAQSFLPLPELVTAAERLLGVDIDVLVRAGADRSRARRHLDQLAEVAAEFCDGAKEPSLGGFLAWLEAAVEHERGLDTVEVDVDPDAVQVLTVHAAKGLEWDVVAVVGLAEGVFPAYDGPPRPDPAVSAWLTALAALPYPLRRDAEDLPELDVETPATHADTAAECTAFRTRAGAHLLQEERRLAYVAVTRARSELVLSASFWKEHAGNPRPPSRFLGELRRAGVLSELRGAQDWTQPAESENPLLADRSGVAWPRRQPGPVVEAATRSAEAVRAAGERAPGAARQRSGRAEAWVRDVAALLAERDADASAGVPASVPAHLSASAVVRMAADPAGFALDRARPVPVAPSRSARRGTAFHAWVERHYGAATLLDLDDLSSADDALAVPDTELARLQEAFLRSPFASRTPVAIEVSLETPVAGTVVRCRADAVFAWGDGVLVVDWKTGPPPADAALARARVLQLALYRLGWSRLHGVPLARVGAAFYHVAEDRLVHAEPWTEDEIVAAVAAARDGGRPVPQGARESRQSAQRVEVG